MQTNDGLAAEIGTDPWKHGVHKAGQRTAEHCPTELRRVNAVLRVRFTHRSRVFMKQAD
ncbi:MAG TPA: hypothetical protein VGO37_18745 [Steroidobacteraceae bacterium]|jgi:hypothetical protein|nr:hypothetical protein [Steroidobacteraceae bacterium]